MLIYHKGNMVAMDTGNGPKSSVDGAILFLTYDKHGDRP